MTTTTAAVTMVEVHALGENLRGCIGYFVRVYQGAQMMLEHADVPVVGSAAQIAVIRNHGGPLEEAAEHMRQALLVLEPVWPRAVALAQNPEVNGLSEKQTEQIRGWCQLFSGDIRTAQMLLDLYYRSRWYNESPRRVTRLAAYFYHAPTQIAQAAVNAVYVAAAGPEYIQEQEEARQAAEDLEDEQKEGFDFTSVGGLVVGLGAGLLGVWFLRRKR